MGKPSLIIAKVSQEHLHDCVSDSSSSSYDSFKSSEDERNDEEKPKLTEKDKAQAKAKALLRHRIHNPLPELPDPQDEVSEVRLDEESESKQHYGR